MPSGMSLPTSMEQRSLGAPSLSRKSTIADHGGDFHHGDIIRIIGAYNHLRDALKPSRTAPPIASSRPRILAIYQAQGPSKWPLGDRRGLAYLEITFDLIDADMPDILPHRRVDHVLADITGPITNTLQGPCRPHNIE